MGCLKDKKVSKRDSPISELLNAVCNLVYRTNAAKIPSKKISLCFFNEFLKISRELRL